MAKNLKINIKNEQLQKALNLGGLKEKLGKKIKGKEEEKTAAAKEIVHEEVQEEQPRVKARSKSVFAEEKQQAEPFAEAPITPTEDHVHEEEVTPTTVIEEIIPEPEAAVEEEVQPTFEEIVVEKVEEPKEPVAVEAPVIQNAAPVKETPKYPEYVVPPPQKERLGPTGRHVKDLLPKKKVPEKPAPRPGEARTDRAPPPPPKEVPFEVGKESTERKQPKQSKFKDFKDIKPAKVSTGKSFDSRDRQGLRESDDEGSSWRRRKPKASKHVVVEEIIRPTSLKVRLPISIKDLAQEMKIKASQLIEKLFLQGMIVTINTPLDDETTIQLLGQEFGCEIEIDTTQEERIRITDKTIAEEIKEADPSLLKVRPPIVTFMGHVDHGKTSLIDYIRESNRTSSEAGAITQHIGAFRCHTDVGDIAILDTPGHEAFSAMRARGANVTDIVVLVIAGDEGIRAQTNEAVQHAKAAGVTIVVALNKCDKPNFNAENVYRQLAEVDLLPEAWGGQTITINCSAVSGQGVKELLEMLALQAEVLELKANPTAVARGTVLESQLHKGMGTIATVLVQNGTLKKGDAVVFEEYWGRVKTMRDEYGTNLEEAGPSTPVEITGLSGHPEAGQDFIVVKSEREARVISEVRQQNLKQSRMVQGQKLTIENLFQNAPKKGVKTLNIILRGDVQGSVEALKTALQKIHSEKAELNIIFSGVGEVSESDVQLAIASKAVIIGFHTQVEYHAESIIKQHGVQVYLFDIIYHAIDHVKKLMEGLLDKVAKEVTRGTAKVLTTFKSSQLGIIAGCLVTDGSIVRSNQIRVTRDGEHIWKGSLSSLRRMKDDVREVQKDFECGIVLNGFSDYKEGDILESIEITYSTQEL